MRIAVLCSCFILTFFAAFGQKKKDVPTVYVDKHGVMRWSDTKQEASFYGVNYTVPFAHAYRALQYKGIDHKAAIDRDVYHFARLGFNAYRIHVWDVEIADGKGNILENEHLDLLDYLFFKLQERGIRILVTTMTNFGNGYPERNTNTGAFSYLYDKCRIHEIPEAIAAQKRYVGQLLQHVNAYTGVSYQDDPYVIGFEINNEPCHTGLVATTEKYIHEMLGSMKKAGNKKPVFYNVGHNMDHVPAYFSSMVQGTTYQWYPMGLLASIGTGFILFNNGIMLGAFHQMFFQYGVMGKAMSAIWIHGTIEISVIIIAGGCGIALGNSMLFPKSYTRMESFVSTAKIALKVLISTVPFFIVAGTLEGFVTRYYALSAWVYAPAIVLSLLAILYFYVYKPLRLAREKQWK